MSRKHHDDSHDWSKDVLKDDQVTLDDNDGKDVDIPKQRKGSHNDEDDARTIMYEASPASESGWSHPSELELKEHISNMEERRKKSEDISEVLEWVNRSCKLEEKRNAEKEKALQLSKIFETLICLKLERKKWRDGAYRAAKKKTGIYDDNFNDKPGSEKKKLPQYDDPVSDEGVTLDAGERLLLMSTFQFGSKRYF
ncbi:hypothetical protein F0562_015584 [Nyssa sinensis]|uniref:Uncharacterized protein n=1 Tax=Nyssa sinensis TaxID=561372 RepID=A0A5J4ZHQ2_9ASTE|nr:hypothetical protein F0562_015584 [Nyssa sinensis]